MKYMIMMFGCVGATIESQTPEWIAGMHKLVQDLDTELREAGELVDGRPLVDPSQARTVRFQNGAPVPTDGPFAEIKESLAGRSRRGARSASSRGGRRSAPGYTASPPPPA